MHIIEITYNNLFKIHIHCSNLNVMQLNTTWAVVRSMQCGPYFVTDVTAKVCTHCDQMRHIKLVLLVLGSWALSVAVELAHGSVRLSPTHV